MKQLLALVAAGLVSLTAFAAPEAALAQQDQSMSCAWTCTVTLPSESDRATRQREAYDAWVLAHGGGTPTTNVNGDVINNTTYTGAVNSTSTGATNIGQYSQNNASVRGDNSMIQLDVTTGQTGTTFDQAARATTTSTGNTTNNNH